MKRMQVSDFRTVIFNRDSVCMADDVSDHAERRRVTSDMLLSSLISLVEDYLPFLSGDVVWSVGSNIGICAYITKEGEKKYVSELCFEDISISELSITDIDCRHYYDTGFCTNPDTVNKYAGCTSLLEKVKKRDSERLE